MNRLAVVGHHLHPECRDHQLAVAGSAARCCDEVPVAHTPAGGFQEEFPPPILGKCPGGCVLVEGAPDLRGLWRTVRVERAGKLLPDSHLMYTYVERIEQCGNRIVDCGGGTVADARCDGTEANGVHDVSAFDYTTPLHVVASYEVRIRMQPIRARSDALRWQRASATR